MKYEYCIEIDPGSSVTVFQNGDECFLVVEQEKPIKGLAHPDRALHEVASEVADFYLQLDLSRQLSNPRPPQEKAS